MNVVAIGGGHGLSATATALRMIDHLTLSAIVGTTDNGGSTGDIRKWSNCIAWGDLRHVLNSLTELKSPTMQSRLFEFRFGEHEGPLSEESLGNIMLHALEHIADRPQHALDMVCEWLEVDARVIPMSEEVTDLVAEAGNERISGETQVDHMRSLPRRLKLSNPVSATPEAIAAIEAADLIILGPGSVMTSVLPSLLVTDVQNALVASTAQKIWVQNQGHEEGPMGRLATEDTHQWLESILGFDYCDAILADKSADASNISKRVILADLKDDVDATRYSVAKLSAEFRRLLSA